VQQQGGRALSVRWATSDVTARGVSTAQGRACAALPLAHRAAALCGDYIAGAGEVTFRPGVTRVDIVVAIMEDDCSGGGSVGERSFAVDLFTPGGGWIPGERATVVIQEKGGRACA